MDKKMEKCKKNVNRKKKFSKMEKKMLTKNIKMYGNGHLNIAARCMQISCGTY